MAKLEKIAVDRSVSRTAEVPYIAGGTELRERTELLLQLYVILILRLSVCLVYLCTVKQMSVTIYSSGC